MSWRAEQEALTRVPFSPKPPEGRNEQAQEKREKEDDICDLVCITSSKSFYYFSFLVHVTNMLGPYIYFWFWVIQTFRGRSQIWLGRMQTVIYYSIIHRCFTRCQMLYILHVRVASGLQEGDFNQLYDVSCDLWRTNMHGNIYVICSIFYQAMVEWE